MKTSNKLLIGLFVVIVLGMIIANIALNKEIEKTPQIKSQVEITMPTDTTTADSIAMDAAISNE
ncbi:MAG TPA: hypothetical protein VIK55_05320 [Paludibacter sp.]